MLRSAMRYSHKLLSDAIYKGGIAVDATAGNGHDTLFLSQKVKEDGHVYTFDIQEQAIQNTKQRLDENDCHNVTLIHDGHEHIDQYLPDDIEIDVAIFNLGYLPSSDKHIITHQDTTLTAVEWIIHHLKPQGRCVLVLYYGHEGGNEEKEAVIQFASQLPQDSYQVLCYQFINQRNAPPICLCIEKK